MDKIGIILTVHNDIQYLESCLEAWVSYRKHNPLLIAVVDVCFVENQGGNSTDGTIELLKQYRTDNKIDYFEVLSGNLKESDARNIPLKWLLDQGAQLITSIGADEIFHLNQIQEIFSYVEKEKFIAVFKLHYKNFVGDKWHYVLGFTPHRIWRVNYNGWILSQFFWDDDIVYQKGGITTKDKDLPIKLIPSIKINHFTWCDLERSKGKIYYQSQHFNHCSYRVINNRIGFDLDYYRKTGQPIPEIHSEINYYTGPYGKFVIEPEDGVCRTIKEGRFWDEWLKPYLDGLTKKDTFVDVGSHIGFFTVYAALKCKYVYSFEPQLINFERLAANINLNNLENVTPYNVALYGKNCKMAVSNIPSQKDVNYGRLQACSLPLFENESGDVEARTLDSYGLEEVSFMKFDCEECDLQAIKGSIETIKRCRPAIIYECGDHRVVNEARELFRHLNYNIKEVAGQNYLATPS